VPINKDNHPGLTSFATSYRLNTRGFGSRLESRNSVKGVNVESASEVDVRNRAARAQFHDNGHNRGTQFALRYGGVFSWSMAYISEQDGTPLTSLSLPKILSKPANCEVVRWDRASGRAPSFEDTYGAESLLVRLDELGIADKNRQIAVRAEVGEMLGPIDAIRYTIDEAGTSRLAATVHKGFDGTASGNIWLAREGGYFVKADVRMTGKVLPDFSDNLLTGGPMVSPMSGTITVTAEIFDINKPVNVMLQPECAATPARKPYHNEGRPVAK
jgi:hypothetical protein